MKRYLYLAGHAQGGLNLVLTGEGHDPIGPHNAAQVARRLRDMAEILEADATWKHIPAVLSAAVMLWRERDQEARQDEADARYEASKDPDAPGPQFDVPARNFEEVAP
jgi:hypothetical protein